MEAPESPSPAEATAPADRIRPESPLISVPEAAALLGQSKEYLYAGLRDGKFPGAKFGRSRSLSRPFLESFLAEIERGRSLDFEEYAVRWLAEHDSPPGQ